MCETCLYNKNCQFLAKHPKTNVDSCTAFKSEAELRAEVASEFFEEIENLFEDCIESEWLKGSWFNVTKFKESLVELKKKYRKGK